MKNLFLTFKSSSHGGQSESNDPYSSRSPEHIEVTFKLLHREQPKNNFFCDSVEIPDHLFDKDILYLGVVRYSSGDSFGTSHGKWAVVGAYEAYKDAEEAVEEAIKFSPKGSYKPWEGYFERVEETEVHVLRVV